MPQVFVLVGERVNHRPLKLGQKPMLGTRGIRPVEVLFPVQDVDVVPREPACSRASMATCACFGSTIAPTTRLVGYAMKASS